jgi:Flp pilus assembly protein TadB
MTVFFVGIVLAALALFAIVFLVVSPPKPRVSVDRRLEPGTTHVSLLTRATERTVTAIEQSTKGRRRLFDEDELDLAGIKMEPSQFLLVTFSSAAALALLGVLAGFGSLWSVVLAIVFAALAPIGAKVVLAFRTSRRRATFAGQLDDTLQLISGNLRAGYGLVQALDGVARDLDEPTSEEFARVVNETRLGRELGPALEVTAERMRSDDFRWAAQAIMINRETGGNLAEVLENVAGTIRERNEIRRQVQALSAEGRLSATVLSALPVVVFAAVLLIQPTYFTIFFTTIVGVAALIVSLLLLGVGIFWMYRVTKVRF